MELGFFFKAVTVENIRWIVCNALCYAMLRYVYVEFTWAAAC